MRMIGLVLLFVGIAACANSQTEEKKETTLQINIDPTELLYYFPKFGMGLEFKNNRYGLWSTFHYGSDAIGIKYKPRFYDGQYKIVGIAGGVKKYFPSGSGAFIFGTQIQFDKTSANVEDDVYYDIPKKEAVLFDRAQYQRSRIGLFIDYGYVYDLGQRFTIEVSIGTGLRRIKKWYADINNPFELEAVEPVKFKEKFDYKYVRTEFRPALIGSLKVGYRIF